MASNNLQDNNIPVPATFKQKLPESEKNEQWAKECMNFIASHGKHPEDLDGDKLYRAYNGYLDEADYSWLTNPYGSQSERAKTFKFPGKLRNYPIIKPVIDLLVGEKSKRFTGWQVVVSNPDSVNIYRDQLNEKLRKNLEQRAINVLNQLGFPTGVESEPNLPKPEQVYADFKASYRDSRAIVGQEALDYIIFYHRIFDQFLRGFLDFCIYGEVSSSRTIEGDELKYEIFSPQQFEYEKGPNNIFAEEANWQKRTWQMTNSQTLDMFKEDGLTEKDLESLEEPEDMTMRGTSNAGFTTYIMGGSGVSYLEDTAGRKGHPTKMNTIDHCVWRAWREVGVVPYIDEFGQPQETLVDRSYKGKDVSEWFWVSDPWEGYRIDGKHFVRMRRIPYTINSMSRANRVPLPYNGRVYSDRHTRKQSPTNIGIPYQALYNMLHYKFEQTMAKNKDKIILMDYHAIPRQFGWDEYKFMYMADAFGWVFFDRSGKADKQFNQYQVLDASLGQYAASMIDLMQSVKAEYEETLGINRQRKGQMAASDTVGGTQFALGQSAVMNEELFRKYEEFEEREMQYLLDLSQYAWRNGKKATFINSDRRNVILDIDPAVYPNADYGVFAKNNAKENEKLTQIKSLVDRIAQNPETTNVELAEILDSDNYAGLKEKLQKADDLKREFDERVQAANQELKLLKLKMHVQLERMRTSRTNLIVKVESVLQLYKPEHHLLVEMMQVLMM